MKTLENNNGDINDENTNEVSEHYAGALCRAVVYVTIKLL